MFFIEIKHNLYIKDNFKSSNVLVLTNYATASPGRQNPCLETSYLRGKLVQFIIVSYFHGWVWKGLNVKKLNVVTGCSVERVKCEGTQCSHWLQCGM